MTAADCTIVLFLVFRHMHDMIAFIQTVLQVKYLLQLIFYVRRVNGFGYIPKKNLFVCSQLKSELREIRRKGAKKAELSYSSHVCERCNATTGHIINKAHTCPACKHKVTLTNLY